MSARGAHVDRIRRSVKAAGSIVRVCADFLATKSGTVGRRRIRRTSSRPGQSLRKPSVTGLDEEAILNSSSIIVASKGEDTVFERVGRFFRK
jgi:hypothetical protein